MEVECRHISQLPLPWGEEDAVGPGGRKSLLLPDNARRVHRSVQKVIKMREIVAVQASTAGKRKGNCRRGCRVEDELT